MQQLEVINILKNDLNFTDQSIEKVYGKENIFYFEGNLGKSVFVDTHHGLHKGTIQEPGSTRVMLAVYFKLE